MYAMDLIDEETFIQEYNYLIEWVSKSAYYLMDKYKASIYMNHLHLIDSLEHGLLGSIDPAGGRYNPETAQKALHKLRTGYQIADKLAGSFLNLMDESTYLIVVSDHGNSPNRKAYSLANPLAEKGLIEIKENAKGKKIIDWSSSKILIDLTNIYINLKSRYKDGVVEDQEYKEIQSQVIDVLRSAKDQDNEYVVAFALRKKDAPIIGLWGEHVGDIVYVFSSGFTWGTRLRTEKDSVKSGGANHGPQLPTTETEISSNYATFMITGKDIKKSYVRSQEQMGPVCLVDIAPTIAHILDIKPPRHSQGRILHDFFKGWDTTKMERRRQPLKFSVELDLRGDVTDQQYQRTDIEK
jgi:predicted AlkP superfamily phosphohydrolase/phosphomutase